MSDWHDDHYYNDFDSDEAWLSGAPMFDESGHMISHNVLTLS